jgi:molybdopterin-guanine dinucleotide biosynthesis protein A
VNQQNSTTGVSGIILAGGASSRFGLNKALLKVGDLPLVAKVANRLRSVVDDLVLVTNLPEQFGFLGLTMVGDIYRGIGTLGGLHAGLSAIRTRYGFVVGCDMPFLNADLLRYMVSVRDRADVIMPRLGRYYEPLHAVYAIQCLPNIEQSIKAGQRRVLRACDGLRIRYVDEEEIARYDPHHRSFFNVNTPDDLQRMNEILESDPEA